MEFVIQSEANGGAAGMMNNAALALAG